MSKLSKYKKFKTTRIHRSKLKNAPYNPRKIEPHARKKLKQKIEKVGLVETLVWNKKTGNLVSGHQRLSLLDELEKNEDYEIDIAEVNVSSRVEKELNVFLNNESVQGYWDSEKLEELIKDCEMQFDGMGFDKADLQVLIDSPEISGMFDDAKEPFADEIDKLKEIRDKERTDTPAAELMDNEHYLVVVFTDRDTTDKFIDAFDLDPDIRYVDGIRLANNAGIKLK